MIRTLCPSTIGDLLAMIDAKAPLLMRYGGLVENSSPCAAPIVTPEQRLAMQTMIRQGATTAEVCHKMNLSPTCVRRHTAEVRKEMREARK